MENYNGECAEDTQPLTQQPPAPKKFYVTVEPIFFVLFFTLSLTDAAGTNLVLTRTCTMIYGFSKENCTGELLPSIDDTIQPYVAKVVMGKLLIESIFPAILSLYIGSWTDTIKRRKPFLIAPLIGMISDHVVMLTFAYFPLPPLYFVLGVIPFSLSGGFVSLFASGYSYLADITKQDNRSYRMSLMNIALSAGTLIGYLVSFEMYKRIPDDTIYPIFYGSSTACLILVLLFSIFLLPEPLTREEQDDKSVRKSYFDISHIKQSIDVLFKERPSRGRCVLFLFIAILVLDILIFEGDMSFRYLSLKASFSWSAEDYNIFSAVLSGTSVVTGLLGVWVLNKLLNLSESLIVLLIVIVCILSTVLMGLSKTPFGYYCAALLGCFVELISPNIKSGMSSLVPNEDIGKIFAFTSTMEAVIPFAASPAYTAVYDTIVSYKPLYINFLSAAFWLLALVFSIAIVTLNCCNTSNNHQPLQEERINDNESNSIDNSEDS